MNSIFEVLQELAQDSEHQVSLATSTTVYKGKIKKVYKDCVEFQDTTKVNATPIFIPFTAIESFGKVKLS